MLEMSFMVSEATNETFQPKDDWYLTHFDETKFLRAPNCKVVLNYVLVPITGVG